MRHYLKVLVVLVCHLALINTAVADVSPDIFSQNYNQNDVKVSPDGKYLAIAVVKDGGRTLVVVDRDTMQPVGGVNFGRIQDVGNYFWVTEERLVMEILHRTDWDDQKRFYGELYAIDYNGRHGEMIYGFRSGEKQVGSIRKRKEAVFGWGRVVSTLPEDPKHILISSTELPGGSELMLDKQKRDEVDINEMRKLYSTVHRLNIHNGKMGPTLARSPAPNSAFFTREDGEIVYAIGGENDNAKRAYKYVNEEWVPLTLADDKMSVPVGFDDQLQHVFYLADNEQGNTCLFSKELSSGAVKEMPDMCGVSYSDVVISSDNVSPVAVMPDESQYKFLVGVNKEADFFSRVAEVFTGQKITITSGSDNGEFYVVKAVDAQNNQGFYLYNGGSNEIARVL